MAKKDLNSASAHSAKNWLHKTNKLLGIAYNENTKVQNIPNKESSLAKKIEEMIALRNKARQNKDYKKADTIRANLQKIGIEIMDSPKGTIWQEIVKIGK